MAEVALERFKEIPLVEKLTAEQVEALQPRVLEVRLSKGEALFRPGEPAACVYFVETGRVVEEERQVGAQRLVRRHAGPGEYLGRYAIVTGRPYRISAVAEEDTTLLAIPVRDLTPILFSHSDWRSWFYRTDIAARLRAVPLFFNFDDWDIYRLADQVQVLNYPAGTPIFEAGDAADSFYVIDQGQVVETASPTMRPPGDWPRYFAAGNFFGRHSLMHSQKRRATAVARKPTRLFRFPGQVLQDLLEERTDDLPADLARTDLPARLGKVPLFSSLSGEHLRLLAGYVSLEFHRPGDIIARQGEPATSLMILDEGEAIVRLQVGQGQPRPVSYLKAYPKGAAPSAQPGAEEVVYFGDHALLAEEMRGATVEVTRPSVWIVLDQDDFQQFLADAGLTPADLKQVDRVDAQASAPPSTREQVPELAYQVRRHWIVPAMRILPLAVVMIIVTVLVAADVIVELPHGVRQGILLGGIVLLVLLALWTVYRYVDWWNDTYEVTSEAVIHSERQLLLSEQRYEIPLQQIQNVNIVVSILGRLLGYGDVAIDTAAATGQIHFTRIPEPAYVQGLIQKAAAEARSGQQVERRESIREQLEDRLYPERLKPAPQGSVLIQPTPEPPAPPRFAPFRTLSGWLPRFEIREGDRVIWRKHWINLLQRTGLADLAALVTTYLLFAYALAFVTGSFGSRKPLLLPPVSWLGFQGWLFLVIGVLWIGSVLWFLYRYIDWRNDIYVVTDNEVIDVERELAMFPFWFFYTESRKQASLANVQYVDVKIPSPLAMVLSYGDVIVQTAGAEGTLTFLFVSKPRQVHDEVLRRVAAFRDRQRQREFEERWGGIAEWFETYRDIMEQNETGRD